MHKYKILLVITFAISISGCGGSDTDSSTTTAPVNASDTDNISIAIAKSSTVTISGNENFELEQEVKFGCKDDLIHIQTFTSAPKLDIYLPAGISKGTYDLVDYNANSEISYVENKAIVTLSGKFKPGSAYGTFYFKNSSGSIRVLEKPSKAGEQFKASLNASLSSKDNGQVQVKAELNLKADGFLMMNCQL